MLEVTISDALLELGVPPHLSGYDTLISAIKLVVEQPELARQLVHGLYPKVAEMHGKTDKQVEKNMRHAIKVSFDLVPAVVMHKYFGHSLYGKTRPTSGAYISAVANRIKRERRLIDECRN